MEAMPSEEVYVLVSQRSTGSFLDGLAGDLGLYWRLIRMQLRAQTQYKLNLLIDIGSYLAVTATEFLAVIIVFGPFPTLLGWRAGEVVLLYGMASVSFGLAELVGAGIDAFPEMIRRGEFDRVMLRPVGVLLQVVGSDFRLRRLGRISQGVFAIGLALHLLPTLRWTPLKVALLPLSIASGAAIFIAVLILGATLCFWTVETTELVNILTYGGREMLSWPMDIYHQAMQRFFLFVIPLAFCSYVPTSYLLDRPLPFGLPGTLAFAAPVVALLFALVAWGVWNVGVRHYQSTGS